MKRLRLTKPTLCREMMAQGTFFPNIQPFEKNNSLFLCVTVFFEPSYLFHSYISFCFSIILSYYHSLVILLFLPALPFLTQPSRFKHSVLPPFKVFSLLLIHLLSLALSLLFFLFPSLFDSFLFLFLRSLQKSLYAANFSVYTLLSFHVGFRHD